ncbi:MAG TPA: hypothetical protein DDZ51_01725, partial [Planctomycetaceae bacterium]|nr:hypothetical protein [Planctomycetaceae bacterium]
PVRIIHSRLFIDAGKPRSPNASLDDMTNANFGRLKLFGALCSTHDRFSLLAPILPINRRQVKKRWVAPSEAPSDEAGGTIRGLTCCEDAYAVTALRLLRPTFHDKTAATVSGHARPSASVAGQDAKLIRYFAGEARRLVT